jgi:hypothetical protein
LHRQREADVEKRLLKNASREHHLRTASERSESEKARVYVYFVLWRVVVCVDRGWRHEPQLLVHRMS